MTTTFTPAQQAEHCLQLAAILERVPSSEYDHTTVVHDCGTPGCAFGHAAAHGMGGLRIVKDGWGLYSVIAPSRSMAGQVADCWPTDRDASNDIFGGGAWDSIFSIDRPKGSNVRGARKLSIKRLRKQAARLTEVAA